ncbi:MAG: 50S ribosomal protein L5 [bacterium]
MKLNERVNKEILPALAKESGFNLMSLPNIEKVIVTVGLGPFIDRKDVLETIEKELALITSQKPKKNIAKKSISGFKLREGQMIAYQVTLRGKRMWDFIEKLVNIVLPRSRSFDGISQKSFDSTSNLTISIREHIDFPEIKQDDVKEVWGMGITFSIKNRHDKESVVKFLTSVGFIFK